MYDRDSINRCLQFIQMSSSFEGCSLLLTFSRETFHKIEGRDSKDANHF